MELYKSAQEIYQVYVTPSSDKSIMLDTALVRGMEDYLHGTKGLQCYFDAQQKCHQLLKEKFFRNFVLSEEYTRFVCQEEADMDDLRAQQEEDETLGLNWNTADADATDDEVLEPVCRMSNTVEGQVKEGYSILIKLHVL